MHGQQLQNEVVFVLPFLGSALGLDNQSLIRARTFEVGGLPSVWQISNYQT